MKTPKKAPPAARKIGRPARPEDAVERQMVGTRLSPALHEKLVNAAAANGRSVSAEMEKRIEQSFEAGPPGPDDVLQTLGRHVMAAFEAGGRLGNPELPASEWMKNSLSYNRAVVRGFEAMLDKHPKPVYGDAIQLIYAIYMRLEQPWRGLLSNLTDEEIRAERTAAQAVVQWMTDRILSAPTYFPPSLLDPSPPTTHHQTDKGRRLTP
jgi:hypothetical protein